MRDDYALVQYGYKQFPTSGHSWNSTYVRKLRQLPIQFFKELKPQLKSKHTLFNLLSLLRLKRHALFKLMNQDVLVISRPLPKLNSPHAKRFIEGLSGLAGIQFDKSILINSYVVNVKWDLLI